MKYTRYITGLVVLLAMGCSRMAQPKVGSVPIVCRAVTRDVAGEQTKGAGVTNMTALRSSGIGIFAWETEDGMPFNGVNPYLQNSEFSYDNGLELWKGGVYWPIDHWLSFFAYSPYSANVSSGALRFPSSDYVSGYPRLQFTPEPLAANQVDLCLATPVMDRSASVSDGVVPLTFSHVLTRLCIQARWTGTSAQIAQVASVGQTIRVLSMRICNVVGSNKLTYGPTSFLWDSPSAGEYDDSYTMSIANGTFRDVALPAAGTYSTNFWNISDACMYLLPQSLLAGSELIVSYGIFNSDGTQFLEESASFDIGNLQQNIWPAGMMMTYSVTIDLTEHYAIEAEISYEGNAGCFVTL